MIEQLRLCLVPKIFRENAKKRKYSKMKGEMKKNKNIKVNKLFLYKTLYTIQLFLKILYKY